MKKLFILIVFLSVFSCDKKDPAMPDDLLSKESMVNILINIHIAEAAISLKDLPSDSAQVLYKRKKQEIFKEHGVASSRFYKSYQYYISDIKGMDDIYAAVIDSLSLREAIGK